MTLLFQYYSQLIQSCESSFVIFYRQVGTINTRWNYAQYLYLDMDLQQSRVNQYVLPPRARGNYTNKFRSTQITTNHFQATLKSITKIIILSMKITPPIEVKNVTLRDQIVRGILPTVKTRINNPVFRGFNIYAKEEPKEKQFEVKTDKYVVTIQQRKVFDLTNKKVFQLFLNVGLRGIMSRLGFIEIGRSGKYFDVSKDTRIDRLKMYKGFSSNFMELERGIFLRVDTARKIVRDDYVLDVINMLYKMHKDKDKEDRRNEVRKVLNNSIIMTSYGKCAFYRILDVVFDKSVNDVRVSNDIPTLKDYYLKKYNIELKNESQPLLEVQNKINKRAKLPNDQGGPTYLLPQLCLMTGIPDDFDESRRKSVSQSTILSPKDKESEIRSFMTLLQNKGQVRHLEEIGIKLSTQLNKMQARTINAPSLAIGGGKYVDRGKQAFFNLFANPLYSTKHDLGCVLIFPKNSDVGGLIGTLQKTSKSLALTLRLQKIELTEVRGEKNYISGIDQALRSKIDPNMLLIVLPNHLKTAYPKLKQYTLTGDKNSNILTQFVTEGTLRRKNGAQSVHTKLLLQMAAKRGNILWVPSYEEDLDNKLGGVMLLAMDSAAKSGKNIMAGCGTINSTFSLLASSTKEFEGNENKFKAMVSVSLGCIQSYCTRNKGVPKEIVIFMNSCTGDQVSLYRTLYIDALNSKLNEVYRSSDVKLTVVMVNLKNSQRFFLPSGSNVPPGTLVSSGVVSLDYDFFIVSQQSNKGCVVPNHYKVIYNTGKLEEGHLQELIHSQCFNYANWSGSIKVPAILQYAKKCAKFNAEVLGGAEASSDLSSKPFFI